MSQGKHLTQYLRQLERDGYQVTTTGRNHRMIKDRDGRFVAVTSGSSRSVSGTRNLLAAVRRHERQYPPERSTA